MAHRWDPNDDQGQAKAAQGEPEGIPKGAKGNPKSGQRQPQAVQKAQLYKQTPDQPPKRPLCFRTHVILTPGACGREVPSCS